MQKSLLLTLIILISPHCLSVTDENIYETPWTTEETKDSINDLPEIVLEALKKKYGDTSNISIPNIVNYHPAWCFEGNSRIAIADYDDDGLPDTAFWLNVANQFILYLYESSSKSLIELETFEGELKDIPIVKATNEPFPEHRIEETMKEYGLLEIPDNTRITVIDACYEKGGFSEYFKVKDGRYVARSGGC